MRLVVDVPGEVVPTARVRVMHGRASTPRRTVEYQAQVARAVRAAVAETSWPARHLGPVAVEVYAYGCERGDPDNILKSALDGLVKGHALVDDGVRVIRSLGIHTTAAGAPGLRIEVEPC
jgi:Holliday junction resolvase RusA-like endonuclease